MVGISPPRKINKRNGFSLIEVMVGMAIMAIALAAIPAAFTGVRQLNYRTDSLQRAGLLVAAGLENLRTMEYETLLEQVEATTTHTVPHPGQSNVNFTVSTHISDGSAELSGMLRAVIEVHWEEQGHSREVAGIAFFSPNGLSDKKFNAAN